MADRIAELVRNESQWTAAGLLATEQARASFSQRSVVRQWDQLLGKGPGDSLQ
jgi:hypothetical protein